MDVCFKNRHNTFNKALKAFFLAVKLERRLFAFAKNSKKAGNIIFLPKNQYVTQA